MDGSLVERFSVIEDPRKGRVEHDLVEMLVIVTCALLSEVETFVDIAEWARHKETWLRRFLKLENGLPSHDTLNRLFRLLDPKVFETVFQTWVGGVLGAFGQVAIDGKSLRGARRKSAVHLVSAFATELGMVLAQKGVADKGNELAAIPELLSVLELRGCLVSLDALGCQRDIARQIRDRDADYLLSVKGNQPTLHQALQNAFTDAPVADAHLQQWRGHGRVTAQMAHVIANTELVDTQNWPDCRTLARIISWRSEGGKAATPEVRYYISSASLSSDELTTAVRRHWAIENDLHWRLDVTFREDACTVRRDHAPENLSIIRRLILNHLKQDTTHPKHSLRLRRKMAAWDDDERARLLGMLTI